MWSVQKNFLVRSIFSKCPNLQQIIFWTGAFILFSPPRKMQPLVRCMVLPLPNSKIKNANTSNFDVQLDVCSFEFCLPVWPSLTVYRFSTTRALRWNYKWFKNKRPQMFFCRHWDRLWVVLHFSSGIVERANRNACALENHPTREVAFCRVGDFCARSRFARSTIPEEKWGTTRSLALRTRTMKNWVWRCN